MKKVELLNIKGEKVKDINLNEEIFGITPNKEVLNDAIIFTMASLRQGTHKTKNRSEVSGGGRKPWRQKGTGRARQGSIRAVQWVGGGRYGTPVPRDYSKKQNRKERQLAIKSALSDRANEKDCVFYNCDNDIFTKFIEDHGFELAWGTFSDISIIAPAWGIAAVNLSVGYLDEHTIIERLVCKWNDATTEKVAKILDDAGWMPKYLYVPRVIQMKPKSAAPSFTFDMDSCLICGRALTPDVSSHLISDEEFPYCVCEECFGAYYMLDEPDAVPFD